MAKGTRLASGYVELGVKWESAQKQIAADFRATEKAAETSGTRAGANYAQGVARGADRAGATLKSGLQEIEKTAGTTGRATGSRYAAGLTREASRVGAQLTADLRDVERSAGSIGRNAGDRYARGFNAEAERARVRLPGAAQAGKSAGGEAAEAFSGGLSTGLAGLAGRGGPVAAAVAAIAVTAGKIVGPQIAAAMQAEAGRGLVQSRLGLDEGAMATVAKSAAAAFTQNWGSSITENMDTAAAAIQSGLLKATDTSAAQSQMIGQLTAVSTILGEDIPSVARSASQAIRTGIAKNATGAFDLLVKSQQNGLNVSGDLLSTVDEYSTQFRKLGLSGPEAFGLLAQAVRGGARDTDVAADALKEFSLRAIDNSESTRDAYEQLGLDADEMRDKVAAGGKSAHDAFIVVTDGIRGIKDPAKQSQVAVQLFGTQAEDLGKALQQFDLSKAVAEFGDVERASQAAADKMANNSANEWETAKRNILSKVTEIRDALDMSHWFDSIPKAINQAFADTPTLTPGAPGIPWSPDNAPGVALNPPGPAGSGTPGQNPLSIFAPTSTPVLSPGMPGGGGRGLLNGPQASAYLDRILAGNTGVGTAMTAAPRVPYGLSADTNSGGYGGSGAQFPSWVYQLGAAFGIKPSTYGNHQTSDRAEAGYAPNPGHLNRGIDWTGPVANLQRFADYLSSIPGALEQVIWENPVTHAKTGIGGGQINPGYYPQSTYDEHGGNDPSNIHVHTRQSMSIPFPPWMQGYARGGAAFGPGGPKGDKIPALLSDNEHVWTSEEVEAVGGQAEMYRLRAMALKGGIPGFSTGGAVKDGVMFYPPEPVQPSDKTRAGGVPDLNPGNGKNQIGLPDWTVPGTTFGPPPDSWWTKPVNPDDILFPDMQEPGSPWKHPPSKRIKLLGYRDGGEVAIEDLLKQGVDPNATQHGTGKGALPGPTPEQLQQIGQSLGGANADPNAKQDYQTDGSGRTQGYIPAAAGNTSVAGTSFISGVYNMGAEVVNGLIDQAASAASTAAGMAIAGGTMGIGAAGGSQAGSALASAAIGIGANAAKRGVSYGAQMLGILTDAGIEQLTPFGAPRLLTTDVTGFMPQQAIMGAATTSIEKAFQQGNRPPGDGPAQHLGTGALPGPAPGPQPAAGGVGQSAGQSPFGPPAAPLPGPTPPPQDAAPQFAAPQDPLTQLFGGVYDTGGWLPPKGVAVNMSRHPEPILNHQQWGDLSAIANSPVAELDPSSGATYDYRTVIESVTVKDVAELERQLEDRRRLNTMRHRGRPGI